LFAKQQQSHEATSSGVFSRAFGEMAPKQLFLTSLLYKAIHSSKQVC
jgi:hypothetical protein